jgi:LysR family transcriptional regulator, benzoate and cis,cis-muconate-responsive activator of ben and cat genes
VELRHLRYFGAVAEAGSLTAAAAQLRMTQPSLSVAIRQLEADAGVQLLVRTPRGVRPTSAGRSLLDASTRILGDVDDVLRELRRFGAGTAGSLTIAAVPVLMWHRIPRLLRAHAAEAPEVEVRLVDPPPWTALDLLQAGAVDIAAVMVADPARFAERHRGELDIVDWGDVPLVGVLPPEEADAPDPLPLRAFEGAELVLPRRTAGVPSLPEAVDAALAGAGVAPGGIRTVETIQTAVPLVEAGIARAIMPDPDRASFARFGVTVRRLQPEPRGLRALVAVRAGAAADATIARLLARVAAPAELAAR